MDSVELQKLNEDEIKNITWEKIICYNLKFLFLPRDTIKKLEKEIISITTYTFVFIVSMFISFSVFIIFVLIENAIIEYNGKVVLIKLLFKIFNNVGFFIYFTLRWWFSLLIVFCVFSILLAIINTMLSNKMYSLKTIIVLTPILIMWETMSFYFNGYRFINIFFSAGYNGILLWGNIHNVWELFFSLLHWLSALCFFVWFPYIIFSLYPGEINFKNGYFLQSIFISICVFLIMEIVSTASWINHNDIFFLKFTEFGAIK